MRAVVLKGYGEPLEVVDDAPEPPKSLGPDDVLVKVLGAGVNPADYKIAQGDLSLVTSLKFPAVPGFDFSGTVLDVGPKVIGFAKGDAVFGKLSPWEALGSGTGAYSETIKVNVKKSALAQKPASTPHLGAAGLGVALITVYAGLCLHGRIQDLTSANVLVIGASGGVGSLAVQVAKHVYGAQVTGICSGKNAEFVKGLGADTIVDYTQGPLKDLLAIPNSFDIILDAVGGDEYWELAQTILKPRGVFSTAIGPWAQGGKLTIGRAASLGGKIAWRKLTCSRSYCMIIDLPSLWPQEVLDWVNSGKIKPVTKHVFDLKDVEQAHDLSRSHRATGKIVLKVADEE